jgi:hypothetical protein
MKAISVSVSEHDYEAFQRAAKRLDRSTAELIREAMAFYRAEKLERRSRLESLPTLAGHRLAGDLPDRGEVWDEILDSGDQR